MLLTDPAPASSVFFMFFKHWESGSREPELRVKVSYNAQPWDVDQLEPLTFTAEQLRHPGHISLDDFLEYVEDKILRWSDLIGEEGGIDDKCATEYIAPPSGMQGFLEPE